MVRSILSVLAGYATMAALVMAGFSIAFVRPEIAFEPGTLNVTTGWLIYTALLSIVAAIVGGWVCRRISDSPRPVEMFALIALALGAASAGQNARRPEPAVSANELAEMKPMDRLKFARQPDPYAFALPVLAVAGILIGGLRFRSKPDRPLEIG
jgi:hypothetical protein